MRLESSRIIFKPCIIEPLEGAEGLILATKCDKNGCEILVRYFVFGNKKVEWFFDFDIELAEPKKSSNFFYKE